MPVSGLSAAAHQAGAHCLSSFLFILQKLALELKKLSLALGNKKDDLLKAVTWPGKDATLLPECFNALEVGLESAQARAAWRSSSLKAGLDHSHSYQVWQL